ncbi:DUF6522 family protein [uncultured Paracoccus sp.]|uniref:DUF6522 family protein n=1 Tax=uncultured Paracoccus sp. TaxID=189685 RepID=UPI002602BFDA|nr:DUF6522 family protein [uncultured Paracoccus sp.]
MTAIEFSEDSVRIDAAVLARTFGISADDLKQGMRAGTITSRFERGEDADAGTVRLIFFSRTRCVRIIADESGNVLTCGAADFAGPPASESGMREAAVSDAGMGHEAAKSAPMGGQDLEYTAHIETLLDLALDGTFPASDPIAVSVDTSARTIRKSGEAP